MPQTRRAASIWPIDALFGLVARNDAEWYQRELLGRTWRRDWAMRNFQRFSGIPEKIWKIRNPGKNQIIGNLSGIGCSGEGWEEGVQAIPPDAEFFNKKRQPTLGPPLSEQDCPRGLAKWRVSTSPTTDDPARPPPRAPPWPTPDSRPPARRAHT